MHSFILFIVIAFDTATGMPYGTVNLLSGVPKGETPVTCTAGVGTYILEFGALTKLTGSFSNGLTQNTAGDGWVL